VARRGGRWNGVRLRAGEAVAAWGCDLGDGRGVLRGCAAGGAGAGGGAGHRALGGGGDRVGGGEFASRVAGGGDAVAGAGRAGGAEAFRAVERVVSGDDGGVSAGAVCERREGSA